jgi:hypothetical protein
MLRDIMLRDIIARMRETYRWHRTKWRNRGILHSWLRIPSLSKASQFTMTMKPCVFGD